MNVKETFIQLHINLADKKENIHVIKNNMQTIKNYCKEMKIKFERKTDSGFIGS